MNNKLSIIIPCYNCSDTLIDSVESCYSGESLENFEIVMVDDGSTDNTIEVMKKLASKYKEISLFFHEVNKGGGAARNTGIKNSKGEIIFCLDSDNILDPGSLNKMINYLLEKKVDGVAFGERRFFHSSNRNKFTSTFYSILEKPIIIDNFFDDSGILLDNFLFTKESFLKTEGYPEHHGFDTQSFEMRYTSSGNILHICPGVFFYHRQNHNKPSYFEREFNKGNFSVNYYFAIEDIWFLFSKYAKKEIISYDIFNNSSFSENIVILLQKLYKDKKLFISQGLNESIDVGEYSKYDEFITNYKKKNYSNAFEVCKGLLQSGVSSKIIYFGIIRAGVGLTGEASNSIEKQTNIVIKGLVTKPEVLNKWYHRNLFTLKLIQLIKKI